MIFIYIFLIKIGKKGILLTCRVTWRASADVARGTTSKVRRGTEATWQSPSGPREAQLALTRGRRPRGRAHADAREGRHMAYGGFAHGGPTGIVGPW